MVGKIKEMVLALQYSSEKISGTNILILPILIF